MICDKCKYKETDEEEWPCKYCYPDTRDQYYSPIEDTLQPKDSQEED